MKTLQFKWVDDLENKHYSLLVNEQNIGKIEDSERGFIAFIGGPKKKLGNRGMYTRIFIPLEYFDTLKEAKIFIEEQLKTAKNIKELLNA